MNLPEFSLPPPLIRQPAFYITINRETNEVTPLSLPSGGVSLITEKLSRVNTTSSQSAEPAILDQIPKKKLAF